MPPAKKLYWAKELNFEGSSGAHAQLRRARARTRRRAVDERGRGHGPARADPRRTCGRSSRWPSSTRVIATREFNTKTDRMAEYGLAALIAARRRRQARLVRQAGRTAAGVQEIHHHRLRRARRVHHEAVRQEGRDRLNETAAETFEVHIEPGGHDIRVPPGENVLTAALAAGIPLPHSCRAGRCASCKSKLLSGRIEYPSGTPPGIMAAEVAKGEVLLCQAQPRSDLSIEARRVPVRGFELCELRDRRPRAIAAARAAAAIALRGRQARCAPGPVRRRRNHAGDAERLAVIGVGAGMLEVECADDGSVFRAWLDASAVPGSTLRVAGPFDRPR